MNELHYTEERKIVILGRILTSLIISSSAYSPKVTSTIILVIRIPSKFWPVQPTGRKYLEAA